MSRLNGKQNQPLSDKLNAHQLDRREQRIQARQTVAQQLSTEHAKTRGVAVLAYQLSLRNWTYTRALVVVVVVKLVVEAGLVYWWFR